MARVNQLNVAPFSPNPSAPTVTPQGTPAGQTWGYKLVGVAANGTTTAASTEGTTATGAATLNSTDFNRLTWTDPLNAVSVRIYRTTSGGTPATLGLIGTVAAGVQQFDDTGLAGDASVAPSTNTTGTGTPVSCGALANKSVQFGGTFVSTNQLQGSINGVDYENEGAAVTAKGVVSVSPSYAFLRVKQTAYTSGSVTVHLAGHENN